MRAHRRAKSMIKRAINKLEDYDGTDPAEVHSALSKHFNSTSTTTAWFVQNNVENLLSEMDWSLDPQYQCNAEQDGSTLAWVPWCVWGADIQVYPLFFTKRDGTERSLDKQASTLVHEWFHKYGCKLDVGYAHEEGYREHSTLRQLLNSDSFGEFAYDVYWRRRPAPAVRLPPMTGDDFIRSLFDISFTRLVTTKVIKFIYILSLIVIALGALVLIISAFTRSVVAGVLVLGIVAPLISLIYLTYVRLLLEIVIAIFRIMETNVELVALARGPEPATATATTAVPPPPAPPSTPPPPSPPAGPPAGG
jgi:hypothetical protein